MEDPSPPLRLLSLDGGGVRGLSSIMILRDIMRGVNEGLPSSERLQPWQVFHMIGGTSTGGLTAVMLGRLRMTLDDCEDAYTRMSERIFKPKRTSHNFFGHSSDFLGANGRFDSEELEDAIKEIIINRHLPEGSLLKDPESPCKVLVGAILTSNSHAVVLRSYENPQKSELLYDSCKIWEACRATSAATTFFEPIAIGPHGQRFADGAVRYNNPVQQVYREATNLWPQRMSTALLVSIGTGSAPGPSFEGNIAHIVKAMKQIVTETQSAADGFMYDHESMVDQDLLFRFNVDQGLADVGLEEYKKRREIADATHAYLNSGETRQKWRKCIHKLRHIYPEVVTTPFTTDEQEYLQTLSFPEIEARRHNIDTALETTCTWLFEHPDFLDWINRNRLTEHSGLLWIKGKPGAGKSTLMKQALQHTEQTFSGQRYAILGFFFNARGSSLERTPLGLFRSLLHQLLRQDRSLLQEVLPGFQEKRRAHGSGWEWHLQELQDLFNFTVTRSKGCPKYVLIDALDECDESSVRQVVSCLTSSLDSALSTGSRLSICLASRHYPNISVRRKLGIRVEGKNDDDISKYVRAKLPIESDEEKELEEKVIEKASGVFMWVKLVVDMLVKAKDDGETTKRMREILEQCPPELDDLYKTMLGKLEDREKPMALKMMQWVLLAMMPLTVTELRFALAFDTPVPYKSQRECQASDDFVRDDEQMEKLLCSQSRGLLEVAMRWGRKRIVQFIHESVRTLLECQKGLQILDPSLDETAIGKGHDQLTKSCINYLSIEELVKELNPEPRVYFPANELYSLYRPYLFLEYALTWWPYHASIAESKGTAQTGLLERFAQPTDHTFRCWMSCSDMQSGDWWSERNGLQGSLLYFACEYNLPTCATVLLDSGVSVNTLGGEYGSPLKIASYNGNETIVRLLLDRGADVTLQTPGHPYTTLECAIEVGDVAIVRLLLEKGANVMGRNGDDETPLHFALHYENEAIVQLLLEYGADVEAKDWIQETAMHTAVAKGNHALVQLLLEKGADIEATTSDQRTAMHLAVRLSNKEIVQLLLQEGANVDARDYHEQTPIHLAFDTEIAQLLLENGANVNAPDASRKTALHIAVERGDDQMGRLLLKRGASIDAREYDYKQTSPFSAASKAKPEQAQLLLEEGADVRTKDNFGSTALHVAAGRNHHRVAMVLLEFGAEVDAENFNGWTALKLAAQCGARATAEILLVRGANVHLTDEEGCTALHHAAHLGHDSVVELLIDYGAKIDARDMSGRTALHQAALWVHGATTEVLLEKGAEIDARNMSGRTALHQAALYSNSPTMKVLLEKAANINKTDNVGWTALHVAANEGHRSIVQILLEYGAKIDVTDGAGHTALDLARLRKHGNVVRCLERALHGQEAAGTQIVETGEPLQAHEADMEAYAADGEDSSASSHSSMARESSEATPTSL